MREQSDNHTGGLTRRQAKKAQENRDEYYGFHGC